VAGVLESGLVDGVGVLGLLTGPTAMAWVGGRLMFLNGSDRLRVVDPAFAPVRAPDPSFDKPITTDFPTVTTMAPGAVGGVATAGGSVAFTSTAGLELMNTTTLVRSVLVPAGTLCQAVFGTPYYLGSIATDGQSFFVATSCGVKRVNAVSGLVSTLTSAPYQSVVFNEDGYLYAPANPIVRIDPDLGSATPLSATPGQPNGLVASDHEQLWTESDGIYRYSKAAGTSTRVTAPTTYSGVNDRVYYGALTRAGTALFVVRGSGVARFDTDRSTVTGIRGLVGNGKADYASIGPPKTPVPTAVFGGDVTFVAPNAVASDGRDLWVTDSNGLHRLQSALPPTMSVLPQYQVDLNLAGMNARTLFVTPRGFETHNWSNGLFVGGKLYMRDSSFNTSGYDWVNTIDTTTGQRAFAFGGVTNIGAAGVDSMTSDGRSIYYSHWQASAQAGDFRRIEKFTPSSGAVTLVSEFDSQANALSSVVWAAPNRLIAVARPPLAASNWELWSVDPMTGDHLTLFVPPITEPVPNFKSDGTSLWWAAGTAVKRMPLTGGPIDTYPVTIPTKVATSSDLRSWNGSITSIELAGNTVLLGVTGNYDLGPGRSYTGYIMAFNKTTFTSSIVSGHYDRGGADDGSDPTFSEIGGLTTNGNELFVGDGIRVRGLSLSNPAFRPTVMKAMKGSAKGSNYVADPVNSATGNFMQHATDLTTPPGVLGMSWARTYNSVAMSTSDLGWGWTHSFSDTLQLSGTSLTFTESSGRQTTFTKDVNGVWQHPAGADASVTTQANGLFTLSWADGSAWDFDLYGSLAKLTFWNGQTVTLQRDAAGLPTLVTSSTGATLTPTYTAGRLTSVATNDGRTVSYTYDTGNNLATAVLPGTVTTTYVNDPSGLLMSVKDPTGVLIAQNTYDPSGRVRTQTAPSGAVTTFMYWANLSTTVHDPVTNTDVNYQHDIDGRVVSVTDPYNKSVSRTYDGQNNPLTATDRSGVQAASTFDANSNLLTTVDPASGTTVYAYDTQNRVKTATEPNGAVTTHAYTGNDRIPTTINAAGSITTNVITNGLVQSVTDADGVKTFYTYSGTKVATVTNGVGDVTTYGYDTRGRVIKVTYPSLKFETIDYDDQGRVWRRTAADGGITVYTFDAAGRTKTMTDPVGAVTTYTYDTAGRLATIKDPVGALTGFTYDGNDHLTKTTLPDGSTTTTSYGPLGRVLSTKDAAGRVTNFGYNAEGQQTTVTAPDGGVTTIGYDSKGRKASSTDPVGRVSTVVYDVFGRVQSQTAPGNLTTTYTYDGRGRPDVVTDPRSGATKTVYTGAGRTATRADAANVLTSAGYDLAGRLKTVDVRGRVTTYGYDADGNRNTIKDPVGLITTTTFDNSGNPLTVTDPAGVVTTNTWSLRRELLTTKVGTQATVVYGYELDGTLKTAKDANGNQTGFGYDTLKNRTSRTNAIGGTDQWTFDPTGRLLTATDPLLRQSVTTYDPVGRPASVTDPTGRKTTTTYNTDGRPASRAVLSGATYTYGYDTAGRVATVKDAALSTWSYGYDSGGALASYTTPTGRTTGWGYDPAGRRSSINYPDGSTYKYTYDYASRIDSITAGERAADSFTGVNGAAPNPDRWAVSTTPNVLYNDALAWDNYSFFATLNVAAVAPAPVHSGTKSIAVTYTAAGGGAAFRTASPVAARPGEGVSFWAYGGTGGNTILINVNPTDTAQAPGAKTVTIPAGVWTQVNASWAELGNPATVAKINLIGATTAIQPTYWVDDLQIGPAPTVLYADALTWENYSFFTTLNLAAVAPAPVRSGTKSIAVTYTSAGGGASFRTASPISANPGGGVSFWAYGGTGGNTILVGVQPTDNGQAPGSKTVIIPAGVWTQVNATWAELGDPATVARINLIGATATIQSTYWIDDLVITGPLAPPPAINTNKLVIAGPNALANLDLTSRAAATADSDVVLTYNATDLTAANRSDVVIAARKTVGSEYRVTLPSIGGTAQVAKRVAGAVTTISTFPIPGTGARKVRFQIQGTNIRTRVWQQADPEPTTWTNQAADTTVTGTGVVGFSINRIAGVNTITIDDWSQTDPTNAPAAIASYGYNADDQVTTETLTGGSRTRTYTTGRLTGFNQTLPGATVNSTLTYDTSGRLQTEATAGVTITYGYDTAGQLLSATPTSGSAVVYTYDTLGRRASSKIGAAAAIPYAYDAASQLATVGATTYTYDTAGRRLTETAAGNTLTYTYDPAGRLGTLSRTQGSTTTKQTRAYDPAGLLTGVTNVTAGVTTTTGFDWDPTTGGVAQLLDLYTPAAVTDTVFGVGGATSTRQGSVSTAIGTDLYGSVISGPLAQSTSYNAFGEPTSATSFEPKLGYRGELTFDSLLYLRNRNDQPATGQFTSRDPINGTPGTTTIGNPYHYVNNSPLMSIDPSGLFAVDDSMFEQLRKAFNDPSWDHAGPNAYGTGVLGKFMNCLDDHNSTSACLNVVANPVYGTVASFGNCLDGGSSVYLCANQGFNPAYSLLVNGDRCITGETAITGNISRAEACALAAVDAANTVATAVGAAKAVTSAAGALEETGQVCRNSFTAETRVLMADGSTKAIADVRIGDHVLATDPATGTTNAHEVVDLITGEGEKHLVDVEVKTKDGVRTIVATRGHPFWVDDQGRWLRADELRSGDELLGPDGTDFAVVGAREHTEFLKVHNLTVEGVHTYYVLAGNQAVLVHNAGGSSSKDPINLGDGYTGRVDTWPGSNDFEVHVYKGGTELGVFGSEGFFPKHGLSADVQVPEGVFNRLKGIAVDKLRAAGRLGPKGTEDISGENWKQPRGC
jgi:RHS repeat-associated protein